MTLELFKRPTSKSDLFEKICAALAGLAFLALFIRKAVAWFDMIDFYSKHNMSYQLSIGAVCAIVFIITRLLIALGCFFSDYMLISGGLFLLSLDYLAEIYRDWRFYGFSLIDYCIDFHIEPLQFIVIAAVLVFVFYPLWPRRFNRYILGLFAFTTFELTALIKAVCSYYISYKGVYTVNLWLLVYMNRGEFLLGLALGLLMCAYMRNVRRHKRRLRV